MGEAELRPPVGAVLAGGLGRRIGGAKATVELAGRPLVEHAVAAVEAAGLEPVVVSKPETHLPPLRCRTLSEPLRPRHPACGLVEALREAAGRPLVAIACDMPFVSAGLLGWLAAAPEPLIAIELNGELEPFPGRYDSAHLADLEAALAAGEPLRRTLARLDPRRLDAAEIARFGPVERLTFNVNTPADLARAERIAGTSVADRS